MNPGHHKAGPWIPIAGATIPGGVELLWKNSETGQISSAVAGKVPHPFTHYAEIRSIKETESEEATEDALTEDERIVYLTAFGTAAATRGTPDECHRLAHWAMKAFRKMHPRGLRG